MDDVRDSQNVIKIIGEDGARNGADNWDDQAVWAAENEYLGWDEAAYVDTTSNLIHDGRQSQPRSGSEQPNKRTRNVEESVLATSPAMVFFKTKLCCRFRLGTCPNFSNCNFAHSIEELRCVPQNRKEIMAAREKERAASADPMEEFQILFPGSSSFMVETQRSYKNRHCKKFYTEEGCPYGDSCIYFHDEQAKDRERVAIILGPGSGVDGAATGNGGGGPVAAPTEGLAVAPTVSNTAPRPSNWKTRICRKWELTAFCPYGNKCIFAHGATELHAYGGGLVAPEANPNRQGLMPSTIVATPGLSAACADGSERVPGRMRRLDKLSKINRIYGDWIDDLQ